jgi:hypothetical protein
MGQKKEREREREREINDGLQVLVNNDRDDGGNTATSNLRLDFSQPRRRHLFPVVSEVPVAIRLQCIAWLLTL